MDLFEKMTNINGFNTDISNTRSYFKYKTRIKGFNRREDMQNI